MQLTCTSITTSAIEYETDSNSSISDTEFEDFSIQSLNKTENEQRSEETNCTLLSSNHQFKHPHLNQSDKWYQLAFGDENVSRIVVGLKNRENSYHDELTRLAESFEGRIVNKVSIKNVTIAVVAEIPTYYASAFMQQARTMEFTSYIQPSMEYKITLMPNDPYWNLQWALRKIEADWAWNTTLGNRSVLVAVVDTGIDYYHEDLIQNYVPLGYDWVYGDSDPYDDHGHGTHIAGIIAATINNSIGIAGLAQVRIMAEKAITYYGFGYDDWLANAIIHATDQGADIISMSWGAYAQSPLIYEAIKYAYDSGVLLVAAAGNEGTSNKLYPAAYEEVIAVAATDMYDQRPYWSNFGEWIELAAPGVDIYSTVPWGYTYASGTSMATPHVSGVAALILSVYPNASRDWLRCWLRYTADDIGDPSFDPYYGYGRINARRALEEPLPPHELLILSWKYPPYVEPDATALINVTIVNMGSTDEFNISVKLIANNIQVDENVISCLPKYSTSTVTLEWSPMAEGMYNITCFVVPVQNETAVENNIVSTFIYVGVPIKAVVLQSAGNIVPEVISNWQVLNTEWYKFGEQLIWIDYSTLNKDNITYEDIANTDADVLIISCAYDPYAGWEFTDDEIEAISRYVKEGHGLIATAGTLYAWVPNNNKLAPLFGLNPNIAWYVTGTDLLHLINSSHPIFEGVPDPFIFMEVGTCLPSDGAWDSNELYNGEYLALGHYLESAIVTRRGLIYIAPWLEIIPAYYHHHLQLLYNAIVWSKYQKPLHELSVTLEAPLALKPFSTETINATVYNLGRSNETNVELMIFINDNPVAHITVPTLATESSLTLSYEWTPTVESTYEVEAYTPLIPGEEEEENNRETANVLVYAYMVAIVKNNDPWLSPANEHILKNYNLPYVIINSNQFGSVNLKPFSKVVIASDQDQTFYYSIETYRWWFEKYVAEGGTLEIHAADGGWHGGEWVGPLPGGISWASYYSDYVQIVDDQHLIVNYPHEISEWELNNWYYSVHGYFYGYPSDAHAILIEGYTSHPAYLELNYGNGTIVASSQTLEWGYRLGYGQILENSLLYYKFTSELAVVLEAPLWLQPASSTLLNLTVWNLGIQDEANVEVLLTVNGTEIHSDTISLLEAKRSVMFQINWTPITIGKYNVTAYVSPVPEETLLVNNKVTKWIYVNPPKLVLFDQTHYADDIEWYSLWVETLIQNGFIIETHQFGELTLQKLVDFDILVLPQPRSFYSTTEVLAVEEFVTSGGGLFVIGDNEPAVYTELTKFSGISWDWEYYGWRGYTNDITPHPVTENVEMAYFSSPVSQLFISEPAVDLIRDGAGYGEVMLAISEVGEGKIACIADEHSIRDGYIMIGDNLQLATNIMRWLYTMPKNDIAVELELPYLINLNTATKINVTVTNRGLLNASNIKVSLYINGTEVWTGIIDVLMPGWTNTTSYTWIPNLQGIYNVTAYVKPIQGEKRLLNNYASGFTEVIVFPDILIVDDDDASNSIRGTSLPEFEEALNLAGLNYVVWEESIGGRPPLSFLKQFRVVIWTCGDNWHWAVDPEDAETLRKYLAQGGALLLEGEDIGYDHRDDTFMIEVAHAIFEVDNTGAPGLAVTFPTHPVAKGLPQEFYWLFDPPYDDGVAPTNGGFEVIYYIGTPWTAVTVYDGFTSDYGGVVYYAFPAYSLYEAERNTLIINSVKWLLSTTYKHDIAIKNMTITPTQVYVGQTVNINVTVKNEGETTETVELKVYCENSSQYSNQTAGQQILSVPNEPHPANAIWIEPSFTDLTDYSLGQRFQVITWLNVSTPTFSWQIMLIYRSSILNATAAGYTADGQSEFFEGLPTFGIPPHFGDLNETHAYVLIAETLLGGYSQSGCGSLCWIEFEIIYKPATPYTGTLHLDSTDTFILDPDLNLIPVDLYNGLYGFHVTPPTPPPIQLPPETIGFAKIQLQPNETQVLTFTWNTAGVEFGNYTIWAFAVPVEREFEIEDNTLVGGVVQVIWKHDIAIVKVKPYRNWVYAEGKIHINVTVENKGDFAENVTVKLYYNYSSNNLIGTYIIENLIPGQNLTISILWNVSNIQPCQKYTITAVAEIDEPDFNPSDNINATVQIKVRIIGDINGDNQVNIRDIALVAYAFGAYPNMPKWNPDADLNQDGVINIKDVVLVASNFGECS